MTQISKLTFRSTLPRGSVSGAKATGKNVQNSFHYQTRNHWRHLANTYM